MTKTQKNNTWKTVSIIAIIILVIAFGIMTFLLNVAQKAYKNQANISKELKTTLDYNNSRNQTRVDSAVYVTDKKGTVQTIKYINNKIQHDTLSLQNNISPDLAIELWTEYMSEYIK